MATEKSDKRASTSTPIVRGLTNGQDSVCGSPISGGKDICTRQAGWGTDHFGEGVCKEHPMSIEESEEEKQQELELRPHNDSNYSIVITHPRLQQFFAQQQEAYDSLDNIDDELRLMRSMIMLAVQDFGSKASINEEGGMELNSELTPLELGREITRFITLIDKLTNAIERKHRIKQLAGEAIPRQEVQNYMAQVTIILNNGLRDRCVECGDEHNMRTKTIDALAALGSI